MGVVKPISGAGAAAAERQPPREVRGNKGKRPRQGGTDGGGEGCGGEGGGERRGRARETSNAGQQGATDLGPAWTERPPVARHSGGKGGPELLAGRPFVVHGSEIGQSAYSVPQFDSVRGSRS